MKASKFSFWAIVIFIVLLTALHFLEREIDPTWRFISEYALGKYGFLMTAAFFFWAFSCIFLVVALWKYLSTILGKIGLVLLLISSIGLLLSAVFTTDPATSEFHTTSGNFHSLGGTLVITMPFAFLFIGLALSKNPAYANAKKTVLITTIFTSIGFLVSAISLGYLFSHNEGKLNPSMWVGLPTRFEVITYCIWLLAISVQTKKAIRHMDT